MDTAAAISGFNPPPPIYRELGYTYGTTTINIPIPRMMEDAQDNLYVLVNDKGQPIRFKGQLEEGDHVMCRSDNDSFPVVIVELNIEEGIGVAKDPVIGSVRNIVFDNGWKVDNTQVVVDNYPRFYPITGGTNYTGTYQN